VFDNHPNIVGTRVGSFTVRHVNSMVADIRETGIKIAILTVPSDAAQATADCLVEAGIKAILSYAPVALMLPKDIHVQYIDPVLRLQRMMYYLGDN